MGQPRLDPLPKTARWREVARLVSKGGDEATLIAATLAAARPDVRSGARDPALRVSLRLLFALARAGGAKNFGRALRDAGLVIDLRRNAASPSLMAIAAAFADAVDAEVQTGGGRTDVGEMAQLAAIETLMRAHVVDGRRAIEPLGDADHLARVVADFFARTWFRWITFFLSRELSNHVGFGERFDSFYDLAKFAERIERHCHQASTVLLGDARVLAASQLHEGDDDKQVDRFASRAMETMREVLAHG